MSMNRLVTLNLNRFFIPQEKSPKDIYRQFAIICMADKISERVFQNICSDNRTKHLFSPIVISDKNFVCQGFPTIKKDRVFDDHFSPIVQNLQFLDDRGRIIVSFSIINKYNESFNSYSCQAINNKNTSKNN
jgi:hypothetical protein